MKNRNPGTYEEIHKKYRNVMPQPFDGMRVVTNRQLNNYLLVSHRWNFGSLNLPSNGYKFGATFVEKKSSSEQSYLENYGNPILVGEISRNGDLNATIVNQSFKRILYKFYSQIVNHAFVHTAVCFDYFGDSFTSSVELTNLNLKNNCGTLAFSLFQNVTDKLAIGAELYCHKQSNGQNAEVTTSFRYDPDQKSQWTGSIKAHSIQLGFFKQIQNHVEIGAEIHADRRTRAIVAALGYKYDMPASNFIYRGMVDTQWNVAGVFEKRLQSSPITFYLSALLNHKNSNLLLGYGLSIG